MSLARTSSQPSNEGSPDSAESSSQAQSTHIRTSCDLCKRMKIKCERQGESCVHCIARGAKCDMTLVKRKKQAKRGNPFKDVESRIQRIESVLFSASGLKFDDEPADVEASGAYEAGDSPADLTDKLSTLLISPEGSSRFVGASSGFSLFSPQGLQWISERTGNNDLSKAISNIASVKTPWPRSQIKIWHHRSPLDREPLPAKEMADVYIAHYFDTFNAVFPLYDRENFYKSYDLHYADGLEVATPWYASLNIVLCFGCMIFNDLQQKRDPKRAEEYELRKMQGWKFFGAAASCFVDLAFGSLLDLNAVQAVIGMAFIQQMSLDAPSIYVVIAVAGRMAYGIGLHRKLDHFGLSESEANQRRNVFWILYYLDKSISIRIGQPSVLVDDDIGIDLPQGIDTSLTLADGSVEYGIFRCIAQLALLESRIYSELYSIRGRNKTELQRLQSVGELDEKLLQWRDSLPVEIRPGENIQCSYDQFVPVIMMHFTYMNCISTVHRASMNHGSWINVQSKQNESILHDQNLNPRVYTSHYICLSTARDTIELLQKLKDSARGSIVRLALYYPLSAFLLLFANILQNPKGSSIANDLRLMKLVTSFSNPSMGSESPFGTSASMQIFYQLYNVAVKFVDTNSATKVKPIKRGYDDIDSGQISRIISPEKPMTHEAMTSTANTGYVQHNREEEDSFRPSTNNVQTQQTGPAYFPHFHSLQMNMPEPISNEELLSSGQFLSSTDLPGIPVLSDTVQWEWDLQNLWNGSFIPEN